MTFDATLLEQAYESCFGNRDAVSSSRYCACFDCLVTMEASVISTFFASGGAWAAACPSCGGDTVLADACGFPMTLPFLKALHLRYLNDAKDPEDEPWPRSIDSTPGELLFRGRSRSRRYATPAEARELLVLLRCNAALLARVDCAHAAAGALLDGLAPVVPNLDADFVRLGAVLHDAGLVLHPSEISAPGDRHEAAGQRLLLARDVEPDLARVCSSHAGWSRMSVSMEELLVALVSRLWRAIRDASLEQAVVQRLSEGANIDTATLERSLVALFDSIAAGGDARLEEATSARAS